MSRTPEERLDDTATMAEDVTLRHIDVEITASHPVVIHDVEYQHVDDMRITHVNGVELKNDHGGNAVRRPSPTCHTCKRALSACRCTVRQKAAQ